MPKLNITTKPLTALSSTAARISFAAAALFFILFAALHFLEPEFDPSWRFISEYELGQYGWLMVIAFLSLMVSSASLFVAICSQIRTIGGYIGLAFLALSTIGFLMAAIFITDPIMIGKATEHGSLHSTGAALGGNIAGAALFLGWSLARNKAWGSIRRSLLWITAIAGVGWVAAIGMSVMIAQSHSKFGPGLLVGWPNRVLIVAYAGWMMALAWRVLQLRTRLDAHSSSPGHIDSV
ncbi:MAG TPA: DUF998 domain-containing protein [Ktedonosporobacter sp.]|nr:DUF998 domain-containing protein [Ktedonosporobacter sp.]